MHLKWISEKSFILMYRRPNFFQSMALLHLKSHWLERPTLKALIYLGSNFLETNLLQSFDLLFQQPNFSVALPLLDCKDHWRYLRKALIWCSSGQFSPSPLTEKQLILEAGFGGPSFTKVQIQLKQNSRGILFVFPVSFFGIRPDCKNRWFQRSTVQSLICLEFKSLEENLSRRIILFLES